MAQTQQMRIKLIANDGMAFEVDQDVAFKSEWIKEMYEGAFNVGVAKKIEVPVTAVDGTILKKVIEYCTEYRNEEYQKKGEKEELTEKDLAYLTVSDKFLIRMMTAANYLAIPGLYDIIFKMFAYIAKGNKAKKTSEIAVKRDFTEEERHRIWRNYELFDL